MTRPQVCKHQVCDYCGERFGMVTQRCWGNKFCKRTCKNAYLRENYRTLSDWIIPRFFFAGGACLATALAVSVLTLLSLASAHAAPSLSAIPVVSRCSKQGRLFDHFVGAGE